MSLCTVSGNLKNILGVSDTGTTVRFTLYNLGYGNVPMVSGSNVVVPLTTDVVVTNGAFSVQLQGNDTIVPSGTLYSVTYYVPGGALGPVLYNIIGSAFDMNSAVPVNTVPPIFYPGGFPTNLSSPIVPTGLINGSNTIFTLPSTPVSIVLVFRNGVLQAPGGSNDYTISGSTITFNYAPLSGDVLLVVY